MKTYDDHENSPCRRREEVTGNSPRKASLPIIIEVRGGIVQDVLNVPPGYEYEVKDYDILETDAEDAANEDSGKRCSPLPPDPEGRNDDRAAWADRAITAFREATGTDAEDALSDLLANLMHWADRHCYDFDAELLRGHEHYEAETASETSHRHRAARSRFA